MSEDKESMLPILNPESTADSYFEALNRQKQSAKVLSHGLCQFDEDD